MMDNADGEGGGGEAFEEPISAFAAAAYIYELTGQLAHMARGASLIELSRLLEAARDRSGLDLIAHGRDGQG